MGPFAEIFRDWKRRVNWTEGEIANKVGVSRAAVNQWLNDVSRPSLEQLPKLSDLLGVPVLELAAIILEQPLAGTQGREPAADGEELRALLAKARTLDDAEVARLNKMIEVLYPTAKKGAKAKAT